MYEPPQRRPAAGLATLQLDVPEWPQRSPAAELMTLQTDVPDYRATAA